MSITGGAIKLAIKLTPDFAVKWGANLILKGIARMTDFSFDLESRKAYLKVTLAGEAEPIEIGVEGFELSEYHGAYTFILRNAQSNKLWLNNILGRVVGRKWPVPVVPQAAPYMGLALELLKPLQVQKQD